MDTETIRAFIEQDVNPLQEKRLHYLEQAENAALKDVDRRTILRRWLKPEDLKLDLKPTQPTISNVPQGMVAMPLANAIKEHKDLVEKYMYQAPLQHKFELLVAAAWNTGTFIYIPDGVEMEQTIEISTSHDESLLSFTLIALGNHAKAHIVNNVSGKSGFCSELVEIHAGEGSTLRYGHVQDISKDSLHFSFKHAHLAKDASLVWMDAMIGSKLSISKSEAHHVGSGANSKTLGVMFADDTQHFDMNPVSHHVATDTSGEMIARGVMKNTSKAVFRGLIKIDKHAARTSSHQQEKMLLLNDGAEADAIPELQIDNNDVSCSHGATIGEVDQDELFYMNARGIDDEVARKLIVEGFVTTITRELNIEGVEEHLLEQITRRL